MNHMRCTFIHISSLLSQPLIYLFDNFIVISSKYFHNHKNTSFIIMLRKTTICAARKFIMITTTLQGCRTKMVSTKTNETFRHNQHNTNIRGSPQTRGYVHQSCHIMWPYLLKSYNLQPQSCHTSFCFLPESIFGLTSTKGKTNYYINSSRFFQYPN